MFRKLATICLLALLAPSAGFAQGEIRVTDASINAGDRVVWTSDNTYVLGGAVFVEDGAELYIEAGTVVKAETGQDNEASALVVARGGNTHTHCVRNAGESP